MQMIIAKSPVSIIMSPFKVLCLLLIVLVGAKEIPLNNDVSNGRDTMHPHRRTNKVESSRNLNLEQEQTADYWKGQAKDFLAKHRNEIFNTKIAKNVVFFLGDGMSIITVAAARTYMGQQEGNPGEESQLAFEKFPVTGLSKTYCVDSQVADSACSATAYLCGVKANDGTIGVTAKVNYGDCDESNDNNTHVESIATMFLEKGRSAGIVTSTRVTHASPAGVYAHTANRDWENDNYVKEDGFDSESCRDIAHQLVHNYPGTQLSVILGGGRREFITNTTIDEEGDAGFRTDDRNLIEEWKKMRNDDGVKNEYVWNRKQLLEVSNDTEFLLGLFESGHCKYNLEADHETEPTLAEMTEAAIKILSKNEKGYFLFVEGGRIDHAHHASRARTALDETVEFSKAINQAVEMTDREDTLIIVTSDHAHVMSFGGYPERGHDILGDVGKNALDNIPYLTLNYANGPGYRPEVDGARVDVTKENMANINFKNPSMVPLLDETHGGEDVGVFALGPWQHLFTGVYEQNTIPHMIAFASCVNDDDSACSSGVINSSTLSLIFIINSILLFLNMP